MSKLNFLLYLNAYDDNNSSNSPNRSNFKWERDINSILVNNPASLEFSLAPGETRSLFNGTRTLTQNGTTQYSLAPVPFTTSMYQLTWVGGATPMFRTGRTVGANAGTGVTVTVNGTVVTFASTSGQMFNLIPGGVVVGDSVRIGNLFNAANQGEWKIISLTNTSFSFINDAGAAEGPITLGSGYLNQIRMYSAAGVQEGDVLSVFGGFSLASQGSYIVTDATDTWVQFSSTNILPQEGPIVTDDIAFYFMAKRLVYMESDQNVSMLINGVAGNEITPDISCGCNGKFKPGMFLRNSTMYSMSVTNNSINTANVFFASVE